MKSGQADGSWSEFKDRVNWYMLVGSISLAISWGGWVTHTLYRAPTRAEVQHENERMAAVIANNTQAVSELARQIAILRTILDERKNSEHGG